MHLILKRETHISWVLFLCLLCNLSRLTPSMETNHQHSFGRTTCVTRDQRGCNCTGDVTYNHTAECRVDHVTDIENYIIDPTSVRRLDLSNNNIQEIPQKSFTNFTEMVYLNLANNNIQELTRGSFFDLKQLVYLSLASNRIQNIRQGTFHGFTRLRELNLRNNNIQHWETTFITQDLPNLYLLNVAQNIYWKPDEQILSLADLKVVYLLPLQEHHRCYLIKKNSTIHNTDYLYVEQFPSNIEQKERKAQLELKHILVDEDCKQKKLIFKDNSYWNVIAVKGFYFHCGFFVSSDERTTSTISMKGNISQTNPWYYLSTLHLCWKTTNVIHILASALGFFTMGFNLIVVITTLRSKVLRESVAHVLVGNIAVADLLVSFYLIIITATRQSMSSAEFYELYLPYYCRIVGVIVLTGQFSSSALTFVMTLERYLAVVYYMKPHIRITMNKSYVAMVMVWILSFTIAVIFMTSPDFSSGPDDMCLPLSAIDGQPVLEYVAGIGLILYIISIALYGHVYFDVKKTNERSVQLQRESKLARRIALIVVTNIFFFFVPFALIAVVTFSPLRQYLSSKAKYMFWRTFGVTCLGINSCLNPVLFSFRNDKFRSEFRKTCCLFRNCVAIEP